MANLVITGAVADRLADLAKHEKRPIEDILERLLDGYEGQRDIPAASPSSSLRDFPVDDLGPWPEGLTLRREDMYGDDER